MSTPNESVPAQEPGSPKPLRVRVRTQAPHLQGFDAAVTLVDEAGKEYSIPVTAVRFDASAGKALNTVTLMLAEADVDVLGDLAGFIVDLETPATKRMLAKHRALPPIEEQKASFDEYAARYERYGDLYKRHPKGEYYAYSEPVSTGDPT